jgi:hypothetical protein
MSLVVKFSEINFQAARILFALWVLNQSKVCAELEIDELINEPNEMLHRDLNALDAFKGRIASGDIPCVERLPDQAADIHYAPSSHCQSWGAFDF